MSNKNLIKEIMDKFIKDLNEGNYIDSESIITNVRRLKLDSDIHDFIVFLINKLKEINETKKVIYDFIFSTDKKEGDKKIKEKINSELNIKETKIINELKNFITNIKNREKQEMEKEISSIKMQFEDYANKINKYIEYLFKQVDDFHKTTQNIDKIKQLNTLVVSVKEELDQKIKDLDEKKAENTDLKNINNKLLKNNNEFKEQIEKLTIDKDAKIQELEKSIKKLDETINDLRYKIQEKNIENYILEGINKKFEEEKKKMTVLKKKWIKTLIHYLNIKIMRNLLV